MTSSNCPFPIIRTVFNRTYRHCPTNGIVYQHIETGESIMGFVFDAIDKQSVLVKHPSSPTTSYFQGMICVEQSKFRFGVTNFVSDQTLCFNIYHCDVSGKKYGNAINRISLCYPQQTIWIASDTNKDEQVLQMETKRHRETGELLPAKTEIETLTPAQNPDESGLYFKVIIFAQRDYPTHARTIVFKYPGQWCVPGKDQVWTTSVPPKRVQAADDVDELLQHLHGVSQDVNNQITFSSNNNGRRNGSNDIDRSGGSRSSGPVWDKRWDSLSLGIGTPQRPNFDFALQTSMAKLSDQTEKVIVKSKTVQMIINWNEHCSLVVGLSIAFNLEFIPETKTETTNEEPPILVNKKYNSDECYICLSDPPLDDSNATRYLRCSHRAVHEKCDQLSPFKICGLCRQPIECKVHPMMVNKKNLSF